MPKDVGIAIMAKLDMMHGPATDPGVDQFVTFNFPAMPWSQEALAFADPAKRFTPENLRLNAYFSDVVNQVPEVAPIYESHGTMVWDVWRLLVSNMKMPPRTLTEAEQAELDAAIALLGAEQGGSPQYHAYIEHRDRWEAAKTALDSNRITMLTSDEPATKAAAEVRAEQLQRAVDAALGEWTVMGFKEEIEAAIHTKERLLSVRFRPGPYLTALDQALRSDLTIGYWADSAFVPHDLGADTARWATLTLDKTEISQLVRGASQTIRDAAAGLALVNEHDSPNPLIERITMQLARARVTRPWFDPLLFLAGGWTWELPDMLCDGADPSDGLMPAYVTDAVFVRNITFELQRDAPQNRAVLNRIAAGKHLQVGMFQVKAQRLADDRIALKAKSVDVARLPAAERTRMAQSFSAAGLSSPQLRLLSELQPAAPPAEPAAPPAVTHSLRARAVAANPPPRIRVPAKPGRRIVDPVLRVRVRDHRAPRPEPSPRPAVPQPRPGPGVRPPPRPAPAEEGLPPTSATDEVDLQVAAFVCRRLPRLPA